MTKGPVRKLAANVEPQEKLKSKQRNEESVITARPNHADRWSISEDEEKRSIYEARHWRGNGQNEDERSGESWVGSLGML